MEFDPQAVAKELLAGKELTKEYSETQIEDIALFIRLNFDGPQGFERLLNPNV